MKEVLPLFQKSGFPTVLDGSGRWLGGEELALLREVIERGCLNRYGGEMVSRFESEAAAWYGVPHALACTSGTAALHIAVAALDLEPGSEIVTTPISDMGTVIGILLCQCIPVFADVDPLSGNVTPETIERAITPRTKAVMPVHLWGQPCEIQAIVELCRERGLFTIEDVSQAHGAVLSGKKLGTFGDIGCYSLQQSKQITAGDGGFIITSNGDLAARARLFHDKAWPRSGPDAVRGHLFIAANYRMNELTGAVALAQLRKLDRILERRRSTADLLRQELEAVPGIHPPELLTDSECAWWRFWFTIDEGVLETSPGEFAKKLVAAGLPFTAGYIPCPLFEYPAIRDRKGFGNSQLPWSLTNEGRELRYDSSDFPGTEEALRSLINMEWNEGIQEEHAEAIVRGIREAAGG